MSETNGVTAWTVLEEAHAALRDAVAGIGPDDWDLPTPDAGWSVAQVVHHSAGDQLAYAAFLTGESGPDFNPFDPAGVRGAEAVGMIDRTAAAAARAFAGVAADAQDVPVPIPPNKLPAATAVGAAALDAAIHAWDIAVATGRPSPLTPGLAAELAPVARQLVEPLRGFAFAAPLEPQEGDGPEAALLRHLGRDPHWAPR